MFFLKILGLFLIAAILAFAGLLLRGVSGLQEEIEAEEAASGRSESGSVGDA